MTKNIFITSIFLGISLFLVWCTQQKKENTVQEITKPIISEQATTTTTIK